MKTAIVGAGAMGSLFGARLAEGRCDVTLVDINRDHVEAIARDGLLFNDNGQSRVVPIMATSNPETVGKADLIILFCKHLHTRAALGSATSMLGPDTFVWTIQNGIGNTDIIAEVVPASRILKGLTSVTAIIERPGAVATNFKGASETFVWPLDSGNPAGLSEIAARFTAVGLPTFTAADIDYRIWRKLVVNCSLTMLSAVVNVGIGPIGETEPGQRMLHAIVAEVVAVARAKGISLELDDALGYVEELRRKAFDHIGSATVDLQLGRATEIDAMNGGVVREGAALGIPTPINAAIYDLVRVVEKTKQQRLTPSI